MYLGRIVELGETQPLYARPRHPYTEALLSAIPVADPGRVRRQIVLEGEVPDPTDPPTGCPFHPRCPYAQPRCAMDVPALRTVGDRQVACHFAEDLELEGAFVESTQSRVGHVAARTSETSQDADET
jgi:peptide/nickel transport system ATP-binding protein